MLFFFSKLINQGDSIMGKAVFQLYPGTINNVCNMHTFQIGLLMKLFDETVLTTEAGRLFQMVAPQYTDYACHNLNSRQGHTIQPMNITTCDRNSISEGIECK